VVEKLTTAYPLAILVPDRLLKVLNLLVWLDQGKITPR
jgi:hypothetical protein